VIHGPHVDVVHEMIDDACATALAEGFGREGDIVAISAGIPFRVPGNTNLLHIARLGGHAAAAAAAGGR
jgi:pyruvate kinase